MIKSAEATSSSSGRTSALSEVLHRGARPAPSSTLRAGAGALLEALPLAHEMGPQMPASRGPDHVSRPPLPPQTGPSSRPGAGAVAPETEAPARVLTRSPRGGLLHHYEQGDTGRAPRARSASVPGYSSSSSGPINIPPAQQRSPHLPAAEPAAVAAVRTARQGPGFSVAAHAERWPGVDERPACQPMC